jgi:[ribosomal protein S5]-alanine N-acetyltransferase
MTIILETKRLLLREWAPADAEALFAIVSDADVMRFVDTGQPWADIERVHNWIGRLQESYRTRGFSRWAIVEKASGRVAGSCGFAPLPWSGEIDFGYLFARNSWGQGYATEIARAVLKYGFERYGFAEVTASVAPEHVASRRVLEKLGFEFRRLAIQEGDEDESAIYNLANPNRAAQEPKSDAD